MRGLVDRVSWVTFRACRMRSRPVPRCRFSSKAAVGSWAPTKVSAWFRFVRSANRIVKRSRLLRVSPNQEQFVSSVADSLREAAEHPDARALYWAVYAEDTPVGFVMIADEVRRPEYIPHYLWKLLIDERYQRQGFGTATLDLIVEYFRGRPGVEVLNTSAARRRRQPPRLLRALRL